MRVHRKAHLEMFVLKAEQVLGDMVLVAPKIKDLYEEAKKLCL
jgi:hypothetical protein